MKYRVIQPHDNGWSCTANTSSYFEVYTTVLQLVEEDRRYIKSVEKKNDRVDIYISPGKGNAVKTFRGLTQLYMIYAEEQYFLKKKQFDQICLLHQDIQEEFRSINPEAILFINGGLMKPL